jgi:hypothetical protein
MADKKKYYKLDEIGIVGTQKKVPAMVKKQVEKKTGEIIRSAKAASAKTRVRKAS